MVAWRGAGPACWQEWRFCRRREILHVQAPIWCIRSRHQSQEVSWRIFCDIFAQLPSPPSPYPIPGLSSKFFFLFLPISLSTEDSFAVPSAPAPKTHHNSQGSLHETSSKGSHNDLSGSNSDLTAHKQSNSLRKTTANSTSDSRRGSADRYVML